MDGWMGALSTDLFFERTRREGGKKKQRFCHVFFLKVVHSASSGISGRLGFLWSLMSLT
jgi:hypothetical protein